MILPNTTYHTYEDMPIRIQDTSKKEEVYIEAVLSQDLPLTISLWADPRKDWVRINIEEGQRLSILNQGQAQININNARFYIPKKHLLESCENTTDFAHAIYFYSPLENYGAFSNFSTHGIEVAGLFYPTVEHYYQSQKFEQLAYREKIRKANTPKIAADLGKNRSRKIISNWEHIKVAVMTTAIEQKIKQHRDFKELLLSTNDRLLIENSPYDNFWGIGRVGSGMNFLGTVLMRQREKYQ